VRQAMQAKADAVVFRVRLKAERFIKINEVEGGSWSSRCLMRLVGARADFSGGTGETDGGFPTRVLEHADPLAVNWPGVARWLALRFWPEIFCEVGLG